MALHTINLKENAPEIVNVSFQTEKVLFYYKNINYCKSTFNIKVTIIKIMARNTEVFALDLSVYLITLYK
jgi:hypothetical protein